MKILSTIFSFFLIEFAFSCETRFDVLKSQTYLMGSGQQLIETIHARRSNCLIACSLNPQCSSAVVDFSNSPNTCSLFTGISNSTYTSNSLNLYKKIGIKTVLIIHFKC